MDNKRKFLRCEICGNLVGMIEDRGPTVVCCGQPMTELKANTADAAQAYRQAMERGSNSYIGIEAAFQYGACALSASNWPQATQVFTQLSADDAPDTKARARVLLGSARLAAQDERGALDAWLGVVYEHRDQQASFDEAVDAAGRLYERLGEPDKAEYLYRLRTDAAARQAAAP